MTAVLDAKIPDGPIEQKWEKHKFDLKLVNPANKRKYEVLVVGTGLAGASAAASLAEMGYNVAVMCIQDSPRRAHSIAAQGGINAAKNYPNDGDSVHRLFYDTVKGGDYRAREANVHRLAEVSVNIIDQCVAQGVPFARDYGGFLDNRSFGGAQVSRTFYARGQTGQQLLLGAYGALSRQVEAGRVRMLARREMLDLVVVRRARGSSRGTSSPEAGRFAGDAVVLATGGTRNVFFLSRTQGMQCQRHLPGKGAGFANPCYTQIHPTCIPVSGDYQSKLTLMSESLRNDGRVWVPKAKEDKRSPDQIPDGERDYYLERKYPSFGNLAPRDISSRAAKQVCDDGRGVGESGLGVYLDFRDAIGRLGRKTVEERYGNLFQMYAKITGDLPGSVRIFRRSVTRWAGSGSTTTMSNLPGLHVLGEANFSDHGANRLGASALMQGSRRLFRDPCTIGHYRLVEASEGDDRPSGVRQGGRGGRRSDAAPARDQREAYGRLLPPGTGAPDVGILWHGPQRRRPEKGVGADPPDPRGILEERPGPRKRRKLQRRDREGRARG